MLKFYKNELRFYFIEIGLTEPPKYGVGEAVTPLSPGSYGPTLQSHALAKKNTVEKLRLLRGDESLTFVIYSMLTKN